jgi:hypothetical protein
MYGRETTEPQDMIKPVRNRDLTDVNMIFSHKRQKKNLKKRKIIRRNIMTEMRKGWNLK